MKKRYIKIFSNKWKSFVRFYHPDRIRSLFSYEDEENEEFVKFIDLIEYIISNPKILKCMRKDIDLYFPNIKQFGYIKAKLNGL